MKRLPFFVTTALVVAIPLIVAAVGQRYLLRWALAPQVEFLERHGVPSGSERLFDFRRRPRLFVAVVFPILFSAVGTAWLFSAMVRRRAVPLAEALTRVAEGSLDAPLPEAPDPEFARVRDAFEQMRRSLDRALQSLAHTDAQRRRLFSDLAHELATPTSVVLGLAEAFARPELSAQAATRAALVDALEREATRLARLVRDVGDLADLDEPDVSFEVVEVDVGALVESVVERIARTEGPPVDRAIGVVHARVDPTRIEQLVTNLLTNALRHGGGGPVRVGLASEDASVVVVVEDGGAGVPDDVVEQLGARLFRVEASRDRKTGGHGLGLAIAKAIARRHGGDLTFDRSPLGGLRARARFPRER